MAADEAQVRRAKFLSSLPRYDGHSNWRTHELALQQWYNLNPVGGDVAWIKNAILFSLTGDAAERASVIGIGTEAFENADSWAAMIALVRNLFLPPADSEISRIAFRTRKQGANEDVGSYLTHKIALFRAAYPDENQRVFNSLLDEAINGFYSKIIKRLVRRQGPANEVQLMEEATRAVASERYAYSGGYAESTSLDGLATVIETANRRQYPARQDPEEPMEIDEIGRERETRSCYKCGQRGHLAKQCPKKKKQKDEKGKRSIKCFNCQENGHIAKNCPKPKKKKKKEEVKAVVEEEEPEVYEDNEN